MPSTPPAAEHGDSASLNQTTQEGPSSVRLSVVDPHSNQSADLTDLGQNQSAPLNATTQQSEGVGDFGWSGYFQAIGLLFLILAVLLAAFMLLRRFGVRAGLGGLNRGDLKVEAQLGLGAKKSVVVVRFLNTRLILGVTDTQINLLTKMDRHDAPAESQQHPERPGQRSRSS